MENKVQRCPYKSQEIVDKLSEADKKGLLEERIVELFTKYEHDMTTIWKCRCFFDKLPDSYFEANIRLMPIKTIIEAMRKMLS